MIKGFVYGFVFVSLVGLAASAAAWGNLVSLALTAVLAAPSRMRFGKLTRLKKAAILLAYVVFHQQVFAFGILLQMRDFGVVFAAVSLGMLLTSVTVGVIVAEALPTDRERVN